MVEEGRILVTGATGYVGGRLVSRLESLGAPIRCLARRPENLVGKVAPTTEVVGGDVLEPESLAAALDGIDTAYYLIHSMGTGEAFEQRDRAGATHFADAARTADVRRIVYLGGLGEAGDELSPHLRSRHEVGEILRASGVPVLEFRASIVLGSGSLSFEMIRALAERLPFMITPRWVEVLAQPIAIDDLLGYLIAARGLDIAESLTVEVGGADQVTYGDLLREYSRQRGLRRLIVPVPFLTPRLSSLWLGLVTPVYARVGRALIDSIQHPTVVLDDSARRLFPAIHPRDHRAAIASALRNEDREFAETSWSDALSSSASEPRSWGGERFGSRLVDSRTIEVEVPPEEAFAPIRRIGGATGWYFGDWLWQLRGAIDLLLGGVGMRRGRRDTERAAPGDALDFWRVEAYEAPRLLRLAAEMKLPGRAWLEFEVTPTERGSRIRQTAEFDPLGLSGLLYWYGIFPLHRLVFKGMLDGIGRAVRGAPRALPRGRQVAALIAFLVAAFAVAGLGGWATSSSVGTWFATLAKPSWNPPSWVFGPVWSVLYAAMAVAAWLVWRTRPRTDAPLVAYWVQLALNLGWSWLFFGLRAPGWALVEIVLLLGSIAVTRSLFARVSRVAGWLFVPYLGWVAFATALNAAIWWLN
ncbi:MAG: DUF2867 domain-containing protein [Fimbriimonadaceae bacterium]|nr:DUF2867 domain-containing protein [Fimbriimonadaceae bacterium]